MTRTPATDSYGRTLGAAAITLCLIAAALIAAVVVAAQPAHSAMRTPTADDPMCTSPATVTPCAQGQLDAERTGRQVDAHRMHSGPTLAQRDAYIAAVLGSSTGYTLTLRIKLLSAGYRVCEAITAGVPQATTVTYLRSAYGFTSPEAWRVLSAATRILCR